MAFPEWRMVHFLLLMKLMVWVITAVGILIKIVMETCGLPVMEVELVNMMVKSLLFLMLKMDCP